MRRTRASQMRRAKRATGSWAVPDSKLSRRDLDQRRALAWLDGYDAARRDIREDNRRRGVLTITAVQSGTIKPGARIVGGHEVGLHGTSLGRPTPVLDDVSE